MALGTVSVCLTVLVLNLHHRDHECPVPDWARRLILTHLSQILCVSARKPRTMAENLQIESSKTGLHGQLKRTVAADAAVLAPALMTSTTFTYTVEECTKAVSCDHNHDWKELAHVLDRLYFCLVFAAMTASTLIILLVPFYKEELHQT